MISRIELTAAALCLALSLYVLLGRTIPLLLLVFVATGIVTSIMFLPFWQDRD